MRWLLLVLLVVACGGELESSYTFEADPEQIIDWDAQPFTIEFDADEIIWPESWECMSLRITDPRFPIGPGIRPRYIKVCGPVVEVEQ